MCLLMTALTATAQEKPIVIPSTCYEGNPFTIRIPVRFPDSMTVQYAWYRNDTLIAGTEKILLPNEKAIAYTIPADKAYGSNVVFHFKYCLNDKYSGVWTRSPRYVVSWYKDVWCNANSGGVIGGGTLVQLCSTNAGGVIGGATVPVCGAGAGGKIGKN